MTAEPDAYLAWVQQCAALLHTALPQPQVPPPLPAPAADAPRCLVFAPHPDDECINGALPYRLRHEAGWRVRSIAVTLGSRPDRQAARWDELTAACAHLGFEPVLPQPGGYGGLQPAQRGSAPWQMAVQGLADLLRREQPQLVLLPHADDGSATHQGVHAVVREAVEAAALPLWAAHTEYWSTLTQANWLVETDAAATATLVRALACHVGEVARNPYHLRLPAWMADTVRRGGELVLGAGAEPPRMDFATLYALQAYDGAAWQPLAAARVSAAGSTLTLAPP